MVVDLGKIVVGIFAQTDTSLGVCALHVVEKISFLKFVQGGVWNVIVRVTRYG